MPGPAPGVPPGPLPLPASASESDPISDLVARAESAVAAGDLPRAIALWSEYRDRSDATAAERAFVDRRLIELRAALVPAPTVVAGPGRIAVLAPLSGSSRIVGDVILRSLLILPRAPGAADLLPVDSASADASAGLARDPAILGAFGVAVAAADTTTAAADLPFIALDERAPAGAHGFAIVHGTEARAAVLARHALVTGCRRIALLAPEAALAASAAARFTELVAAGGGAIVARVGYPPDARAFTVQARALRATPFDALLVLDDADRLELIAPALAAADLWATPRPRAAPGSAVAAGAAGAPANARRPFLLLSTARGLSPQLLRAAGRYVQGAVLAPGFFAADDEPAAADFVARYRAAYAQDPGAVAAYAYDAAALLQRALSGAADRLALARAIAGAGYLGVTGPVRFDGARLRADDPPLYVVDGDVIRRAR